MTSASLHRKSYIPLESNPDVFTNLIRNLGVSSLAFQDIYSIDDPELLSFVPRPALALVLVFPTTETYEKHTSHEEAARQEYTGHGDGEDVIWFRQTIHNACGLYGILHALSNGGARDLIIPGSPLDTLLTTCLPLSPSKRALALEDSRDLEIAHADAARQGSTAAPSSAEDEVDFHYVCFVPSKSGRLYEMDGSKKGPVDKGVDLREGDDMLGENAMKLVKEFIEREKDGNLNFSLMALVPAQ